jgi:hypothetical protein
LVLHPALLLPASSSALSIALAFLIRTTSCSFFPIYLVVVVVVVNALVDVVVGLNDDLKEPDT